MPFQWLEMRITEEKDRRRREAQIRERLPRALDDLHAALSACISAYTQAFGAESAALSRDDGHIRITVNEQRNQTWKPAATVEIASDPLLPGFRIARGEQSLEIEVGMLPNDKVYYRDRELDQFVTIEELTRRILDRSFFPKLAA